MSDSNESTKIKNEIKQEQVNDESSTSTTTIENDLKPELVEKLSEFYTEIDDIKDVNFVSNSKEQIERLLRPGATYFNLNPFDVLQIDPYASIEEIRKKYRRLSMYVHPDKNKDAQERAQKAFEAVNKAYKMLEDEKERKRCLEVVDEARERVDAMIIEKRKKAKRDVKTGEARVDEDDPDKYRHAIYVMTCKLFADVERIKVRESEKKQEEKKRKHDEKELDESKHKVQKEWDRNYEESREGRISSWQTFKSKAPRGAAFKPPKHKPEAR